MTVSPEEPHSQSLDQSSLGPYYFGQLLLDVLWASLLALLSNWL